MSFRVSLLSVSFSILAMIYACVGRTQCHICLPAVSSSLCCVVPVFIDVFSFMALRWISLILLDGHKGLAGAKAVRL